MEELTKKENIYLKDLIKYCYETLKKEETNSNPKTTESIASLQSIKKTSKPRPKIDTSYTTFEKKAIDVWSCVYWRAQKELENDIELILKNVLRFWKWEDGTIFCSTLFAESFVSVHDQLISMFFYILLCL
jgi:hypothetical protein